MTDLDRLLIEQACRRLVTAYCLAADHNDCDGFLGVFSKDARWVRPTGGTIEGHTALRAFFLSRPQHATVRHVVTNDFIEVIDPDNARGISYATVYRHSGDGALPGPAEALQSLIEYRDEYCRTPDGWRICSRHGTTVLRRTQTPASSI
ncbi:nuclear transport factor 2 family protein [Sinorhizobium fredii]|uniref:nuclear transport factor 2 family protein n=1 Tax=Rhizobium fredii TaxID=380 RepID=UPI0030A47209